MKTDNALCARIRGKVQVYIEPLADGKFTVHKAGDYADITATLTRNEFAHCKRIAATRKSNTKEPSDGKR